jgi:lanthanide-dependent methanol dehydrogenase
MKPCPTAVFLAALVALAGCARVTALPQSARTPDTDWRAQAGDAGNRRYSPLAQIDRDNVGQLEPVWRVPTGAQGGHEGGPLVVAGTLYIHTPYPNRVVAIDLADRREKWRYEPRQDASALAILCCDTVSRGLAFGDGMILLQQTDTTLVALDAATGALRWQVKNGDPVRGESASNAPLVADGYVITGIAGGEYGVRGHVTAYALADGHRVWRGYSTGPDADMLMDAQRSMTWSGGRMVPVGSDSSLRSWQGDQWLQGGGTTWGWYAWDPALRLLYYGSGNPGTWNPLQRPGDNRWSMSLWARDIDSGAVRWVYQMTPHDEWDYDGVNEPMLFDAADATGKPRAMLAHFDRNGFAYTLDRATGELLSAAKFDPSVNWATAVDAASGRPLVDPRFSPQHSGEDTRTEGICPATIGAKNQAPAAYSPQTGFFLVPTIHLCMDNEVFEVKYAAGQPYTGADIHMRPVPGDATETGRLIAWDAVRGRIVWSHPERFPLWGGALATAGGLVFYGTLDGHLKALDVRDGRTLWVSPRLASGVVGNVTTWSSGGRQYVAVYSGVGGLAADPDGIARMAGAQAFTRADGELAVFALPVRD